MCGNLCIAIAALLAYLPPPECVNRGRLLAAHAAPIPRGNVEPSALNVLVNAQQVIPPRPHGLGDDGIPACNGNCWQWWQ